MGGVVTRDDVADRQHCLRRAAEDGGLKSQNQSSGTQSIHIHVLWFDQSEVSLINFKFSLQIAHEMLQRFQSFVPIYDTFKDFFKCVLCVTCFESCSRCFLLGRLYLFFP